MRNERYYAIFRTEERTGAGSGRRKGWMGESGGAEELKHEEKKELRHWAVRQRDFTKDQNL